MAKSDVRHKTSLTGVRYRGHPTRRFGLLRDRYYFVRVKVNGKDMEKGVGWASEGMTLEEAGRIRSEFKQSILSGAGSRSEAESLAEN